jgi:hypothetical protein
MREQLKSFLDVSSLCVGASMFQVSRQREYLTLSGGHLPLFRDECTIPLCWLPAILHPSLINGATTSGGCDDAAEVRYENGSTFDMDGLQRDDFALPYHHHHKLTWRQATFHSAEIMLPSFGICNIVWICQLHLLNGTRKKTRAPRALGRRLRLSSTRDSIGSDRIRQSPNIQHNVVQCLNIRRCTDLGVLRKRLCTMHESQ